MTLVRGNQNGSKILKFEIKEVWNLEFINVQLNKKVVTVGEPIKIQFIILGDANSDFEFPFSNESLTEKLIQFRRKE